MTRTWPSIAVGPESRAAVLAGWLRRAAATPAADGWVLRGSIVTAALCPGARAPADVDYLVPGAGASFDPDALAGDAAAIVAAHDATTTLELVGTEVIWPESPAPGLRAIVAGDHGHVVQIDLAMGDPMCVPPHAIAIAGVGDVLACAPETLFAWKLHGLVEFGPGKWRAKDLFDLDLLWRHAGLDAAATRAAVALAFSSRDLALTALDDFRTRPTWGQSRGGVRKWRAFSAAHAGVDELLAVRARVREAITTVVG